MELEQAQELQQNIAEGALAALNRGDNQETISKYEKAIQIIDSTFSVPQADTDQWLSLITQRQFELKEIQAGRSLPEYEPIDQTPRWSGYDIFCVMMDLFAASIHVDSADAREAMFSLAQEMMTTPGFQDRVEKCPAAQQI